MQKFYKGIERFLGSLGEWNLISRELAITWILIKISEYLIGKNITKRKSIY